jgi:hypothetical protein
MKGKSPLPSIPASVFLILSLLVPIVYGRQLLNADGDPARHLRHGREILAQGDVMRVDRFSLLHEGQPYLGLEYGSQVLYALAEKVAGLAGVVALAVLLIATAHALVARFLLRRGVDPLLAYLAGLGSAMVAQIHWLARPHLVTLVLSVVLLDWLDRDRPPPRWHFLLLFLLWANLHAGFVFGLMLIGFYAVGRFIEGWLDASERGTHWKLAGSLVLTAVLSGLVTLLNAYGPDLHRHAFANLSNDYLVNQTDEFQSPNFHWSTAKPFLLSLLAVIAGFAWLRRPLASWHIVVIAATAGSALVYGRNVAVFAVSGLPLAAIYLNRIWNRLPGEAFRRRLGMSSASASTVPWVAGVSLLLFLIAVRGGTVGSAEILPNRFDRHLFPVDLVEQAKQAGLTGRIFNDFRYGGYIQYAWPEQKVFIDGATDVYGADILRAHQTVMGLLPGWRDSLAAWRIDMVLLPTDQPMLNELVQDGAWGVWRCDATAALIRPVAMGVQPGDSALAECRRARSALAEGLEPAIGIPPQP